MIFRKTSEIKKIPKVNTNNIEIKKGQIWEFVGVNDGNPFKKDSFDIEIIDYKQNWVNYKHIPGTMFQNESMKEGIFREIYRFKKTN